MLTSVVHLNCRYLVISKKLSWTLIYSRYLKKLFKNYLESLRFWKHFEKCHSFMSINWSKTWQGACCEFFLLHAVCHVTLFSCTSYVLVMFVTRTSSVIILAFIWFLEYLFVYDSSLKTRNCRILTNVLNVGGRRFKFSLTDLDNYSFYNIIETFFAQIRLQLIILRNFL